MPVDEGREVDVVGYDATDALAAAREAVGDERVLICVAYDTESFATVYVDDRVDAFYEDEAAREEHFSQIHSYVHLDFTERELFEKLFIQPDGVHGFVTYMGNLIALRILAADQGVFLALAPGSDATAAVEAVKEVLESG